jgi:hypothetical protein
MRALLRRRRLVLAAVVLLLAALAVPTAVALLARGGDTEPSSHAGHALNPHPVAGNFKPDGTRLESCTPEKPRCYEQAFGNLAFAAGPKDALALFERTMQADSAVEAGCHRIAHTIGSAALARFHGDVAQAFVRGSSTCWSGYYHGILERAFVDVSSDAELVAAARSVCDDADIRRTTFLAYQCVHGLGHGLMIHSGYNLPYSLRVCDRLASEWDQTSCTGGVFMENIASTYAVRSKWLRDDDPVYPCDAVKERHKLYCYLMVTSRVNQENGYDWRRTAAVCRAVEREWVRTCFESFGRDASGFTRQSPRQAARLCALAGSFAASCFYGAARDMTSNYASGDRASVLCALAPGRARTRCFYGIGTILGNLAASAEGRRSLCREAAAGRNLSACLAGARVRAQGVVQAPS